MTTSELLKQAADQAKVDEAASKAKDEQIAALQAQVAKLTTPATAINLKSVDTFPTTIAAGFTVTLARDGATYALPAPVKLLGDGITIKVADGDGPVPVLKYAADCFDAQNAGNLTLDGFAIQGKGRFIDLGRDVASIANITILGITDGSFIEQSRPANNVMVTGCVQKDFAGRYSVFIDGANWTIKSNTFGPSRNESVIRASSVKAIDAVIDGNVVKAQTATKAAFDFRNYDRFTVTNNQFSGGVMAVGDANGKSGSITIRGNKALDDKAGIKLSHCAGDVVIEDNDATVEVTEPDKGLAFGSVVVKTARPLVILGNVGGDKWPKFKFDAPSVKSFTPSGGWKTYDGAARVRGM